MLAAAASDRNKRALLVFVVLFTLPIEDEVGRIKTAVCPLNLLEILKRIEVQVGRQYRKRWGPREIDLDILIYGDLVLDHPLLRIPHPEMLNRQFVLQPLVEIQPDLIHPSCNQTISQIVCHMATEIETVSWEKKNSDSRQ